jgi:hypothetical protein
MGISPGHEYETKRHAQCKQAGRLSNIRGRIAGVRSTERSEELFSSGDADADHASLLAMGCGHFAGPQPYLKHCGKKYTYLYSDSHEQLIIVS